MRKNFRFRTNFEFRFDHQLKTTRKLESLPAAPLRQAPRPVSTVRPVTDGVAISLRTPAPSDAAQGSLLARRRS